MAYTGETLLTINGLDCSDMLTTYNINAYDLQDADSGDGQNGYTYYNLVRADKFQLELGWEAITETYKNQILNAIAGCSEIPVGFSYAGVGIDKHISCYRGDRKLELIAATHNGSERLFNLTFNLIEQ